MNNTLLLIPIVLKARSPNESTPATVPFLTPSPMSSFWTRGESRTQTLLVSGELRDVHCGGTDYYDDLKKNFLTFGYVSADRPHTTIEVTHAPF